MNRSLANGITLGLLLLVLQQGRVYADLNCPQSNPCSTNVGCTANNYDSYYVCEHLASPLGCCQWFKQIWNFTGTSCTEPNCGEYDNRGRVGFNRDGSFFGSYLCTGPGTTMDNVVAKGT